MTGIEHYLAPASLGEALAALASGEATLLAGGTDLMPASHAGKLRLRPTLINLRHIPELHGIGVEGGRIRIGALATVAELIDDAIVRERVPVLAQAGEHFASGQIRNAATVGGNLCNASPAGDLLVPLLVLDAAVELACAREGAIERREVPLREFFAGPGRTRRAPNELAAAVLIPQPPPGALARFFKFGTRPALDISAISIGIAGVRRGAALHQVRVGFGAVAPTPVRGPRTEAALEGRELARDTIEAAARAARDEVAPISDLRASAWYRSEMIHNMIRRMLEDVARA